MSNPSRPDPPAPTLRWAGAEDAEALAAVHAEAFEKGWSAAEIAALIAMPGGFAVLAELDGPAGFALARAAAGEAELLTLAGRTRFRRRGLAKLLLEAVVGRAAAMEAEVLFLEVASDNEAAQALYAQAGFERAGVRPAYYAWRDGMSADALVLRRTLNTPDR